MSLTRKNGGTLSLVCNPSDQLHDRSDDGEDTILVHDWLRVDQVFGAT